MPHDTGGKESGRTGQQLADHREADNALDHPGTEHERDDLLGQQAERNGHHAILIGEGEQTWTSQ
jgi:hypothetical protein